MYGTLAIVVVAAIVSMIFGLSNVGQAYAQANITSGNMTATPPDGNMTAENATVRGGVSGVGSGGDGDDSGGGGGTNLAVSDPGASGSKPVKK
jgi:hypothetical protein